MGSVLLEYDFECSVVFHPTEYPGNRVCHAAAHTDHRALLSRSAPLSSALISPKLTTRDGSQEEDRLG